MKKEVVKLTRTEAKDYFLAFVIYLDRAPKTFIMMFVPPNKDESMQVRCTIKYKEGAPSYKLKAGRIVELTNGAKDVFLTRTIRTFDKFLKKEFEDGE